VVDDDGFTTEVEEAGGATVLEDDLIAELAEVEDEITEVETTEPELDPLEELAVEVTEPELDPLELEIEVWSVVVDAMKDEVVLTAADVVLE